MDVVLAPSGAGCLLDTECVALMLSPYAAVVGLALDGGWAGWLVVNAASNGVRGAAAVLMRGRTLRSSLLSPLSPPLSR